MCSAAAVRDSDVEEIHLGNRNLNCLESLRRFRNLHRVWLNNNRLLQVDFLSQNYRVSELYLQDNRLTSISGALCHLHSLQILHLHNNQLQSLGDVAYEFRHMTSLRNLTLFGNPISQLPNYRATLVFAVPLLQRFDKTDVEAADKRDALTECNRKMAVLRDASAFGHHIDRRPTTTSDVDRRRMTNYRPGSVHRTSDRTKSNISSQETVTSQSRQCSAMVYTCFDWSKILNSDRRRFSTVQSLTLPDRLTIEL